MNPTRTNRIRKATLGAVFAGATLVGAGFGATVLSGTAANAQTASTSDTSAASSTASSSDSTSSTASSSDSTAGTADSAATAPADGQGQRPPRNGQGPQGTFDPAKGGHVGANGTKEELVTGDIADKVTAAANGAVTGGTIQRVETDAEGATYEAHMTTADGKQVTVKVNADFSVAGVEDGAK